METFLGIIVVLGMAYLIYGRIQDEKKKKLKGGQRDNPNNEQS